MSRMESRLIFILIFFFGVCNINFFGANLNTEATSVGAAVFQCPSNSDFSTNTLKLVLKRYRSKFIYEGIPEWHFPLLEPLKIKGINFETRNQQVGELNLNLTNLTLTKLSTFKINSACVFLYGQKTIINFAIPVISVKGHYQLSGKMGNISPGKDIELSGSGPLEFDLNNVKIHTNVVIALGEPSYLKNFDFDFSVESVNSNLQNLMGNNKYDSEIMNQVVNDVFPDALKHLKPEILSLLRKFLAKETKKIVSHLTFENIFLVLSKMIESS